VHYAEEQAGSHLQAQERLDVLRAIAASMDSDAAEESSDDDSPPPPPSSSSSDEQKEGEAQQWSGDSAAVQAPPFVAPSGKQHEARRAQSPLEFLQLFLTPALMQQIADYTAAHAHARGAAEEWQTSASELYAFIGVHIFMGICRLPEWHMYWSHDYQQPFVAAAFRRDRFEELLRYFTVSEPGAHHHRDDKLSRTRPLIAHLQRVFPRMFAPTRDLTLDEAMIAFKGRSPIKQYIPSKPHKWGYKVYCLASQNYLLHFEVYEGREEAAYEHGSTHETVMRMTQQYHYCNHILFIDNWFTSPTLLDALKAKGMRACGSVRRNRRGMPPISLAQERNLRRGEWIKRQKGDMSVSVWKDQKVVWLLYNHISSGETASLERWNEDGERVSVGCPKAIHDYFYNARSVDVVNQLHYSYLVGRKSTRAWWRLAWWLIDMCITNAYQLWAIANPGINQLNFREQLMRALVKELQSDQEALRVSRGQYASIALAKDHYTVSAPAAGDCAVCSHRPARRTRTHHICAKCQVHLCMGRCFASYHSRGE